MTILKFLLVVILLVVLIPLVRIGMALWSMRTSIRQAQEAARRIYGDGPFRERSAANGRTSAPVGEYADFEEIPGERPVTGSANSDSATTGNTSQVIEAEFEEI